MMCSIVSAWVQHSNRRLSSETETPMECPRVLTVSRHFTMVGSDLTAYQMGWSWIADYTTEACSVLPYSRRE